MGKRSVMGFLTVVIMAGTMVGCSIFPDGTINGIENNTAGDIVSEENRHISEEIDAALSVEADISIPQSMNNVKQYILKLKEVLPESCDNYAQTLENAERKISDRQEIMDESGQLLRIIYTYEDGTSYNSGNNVSYKTVKAKERQYHRYISKSNPQEQSLPLEQLEDFPLDTAVDTAVEFCSQLGIKVSSDYMEYYAMDAEHMTQIMREKALYKSGKSESQGKEIIWEKEDEVYYFIFNSILDESPMSTASFSNESKYAGSTDVAVVVGRNGVEYLDVDTTYEVVETTSITENVDNVTDAINILKAAFQYATSFQKVMINDIKFTYIPVTVQASKQTTAYPAWELSAEVSKTSYKNGAEDSYMENRVYIVNAVTHEWFVERVQ